MGWHPWLRSVAALRLNKDAAFAATFVPALSSKASLTWTVLPRRGGEKVVAARALIRKAQQMRAEELHNAIQ